ncbi:SSI family serine proteinase inhibitor [Saccharopolyspora taberi]|uniref:Protease inhibitor n=1 Tax=Saccharopolyspora taberi TaxID=60895 RepID=A0ABN3VEY7_9PSEU
MTGQRPFCRIAAGVALAVAALVPGVAAATPAQPSTITLTVTENQQPRSVVLQCDPTGGNHPQAAAACAELHAVDGNFQALDRVRPQGKSGGCTKDNRQVKASAVGEWRGRQISHQYSVSNPCMLHQRTGVVFEF